MATTMPVADDGFESLEGERNLVGAGGEAEEAIDAVGVGQGGRLADEPGTGGLDGDAGQGIALFVGDGAEHLGGGNLGCQSCAEECQSEQAQEYLPWSTHHILLYAG